MTDTSKESVERLALFAATAGSGYMAPAMDGRYVRATDYDALAQRCADLEAMIADGYAQMAQIRAEERAAGRREGIEFAANHVDAGIYMGSDGAGNAKFKPMTGAYLRAQSWPMEKEQGK